MKKVKKACIAVMLLLLSVLPVIPARAKASNPIKKEWKVYRKTVKLMRKAEKAKEAYCRLLADLLPQSEGIAGTTDDIYFMCDDMNDDGVPELLLQYGSSSDEGCTQRLYVYRRKVSCIYRSADGRRLVGYYPQSGILMETGDRMGWTLIRYYKLKGKTTTLCAQAQEPDRYMASSYGGRYNIKNRSVSKIKFNKYIKKATGRKRRKEIELIPNTEENIDLN